MSLIRCALSLSSTHDRMPTNARAQPWNECRLTPRHPFSSLRLASHSIRRCMFFEIAGKHQARATALLSVAWTAGTLIGSAAAGFLAMPCDQYASVLTCGEGSVLRRYPFMLSFGGAGMLLFAAAVYCTFAVEESLKRTKGKFAGVLARLLRGGRGGRAARYTALELSSSTGEGGVAVSKDGGDVCVHLHAVDEETGEAGPLCGAQGYREREETDGEEDARALMIEGHDAKRGRGGKRRWFRLREVQVSVFMYFAVALAYASFQELFPIFGSTAVDEGGLSLDSKDVGLLLSIGGGITIPFNLWVYSKAVARIGTIRMARVGSVLAVAMVLATPMLRFLAAGEGGDGRHRTLLWLGAILHSGIVQTARCIVFDAAVTLVNRSSPPEHLGVVNSYSQSMGCLARAFGPASVGYMWTLCKGIEVQGLEVTLPFLFPAVAAASLMPLTWMAPKRIDAYT